VTGPAVTKQGQDEMIRNVGRGHDVSLEYGLLGGDDVVVQVCSCGHRGPPELLGGNPFAAAQLHVPLGDRP
jgi:hypothetical protein